MQTTFSVNKINDASINVQITEQYVFDGMMIYFSRRLETSFIKCNQGISLFNCVPLSKHEIYQHDLEAEACAKATLTTASNCKINKKCAPKLRLDSNAFKQMIKTASSF